jgi:1-phosphofructokinase
MIYTVTLNPSLDYVIRTEDFKLGEINRTSSEEIFEGGKGINVSIVLRNLGIDSIALGFIAGFTGEEIERGVRAHGCKTDFIRLDRGLSRINIKLKSQEETEINAQGPLITQQDIEELNKKLDAIKAEDILILCGSIPNTLPNDVYEKILMHLADKGILFVVDAAKDLLRKVLKFHPFLIKPNHHELGEMFEKVLTTKEDIVSYARKLQNEGARNVLISRAGDGAILLTEEGMIYESKAPKGSVINSVGAGDSMVAGFLAGYMQNNNYEEGLKMGIAAGSASAFSSKLATREEVNVLLAGL